MECYVYRFSTELDAVLFTIPCEEASCRWLDWQEYDKGPGIFHIPSDVFLGVRAQGFHDADIRQLVEDLRTVENLRYLNLTENRGISNDGMAAVGKLKQLRYLNIGSCDINNQGLAFLPALTNLEYLKYFTVLSNMLEGAACLLWLAFCRGKDGDPHWTERLKYIAAVAVFVTLTVVMVFFGQQVHALHALTKSRIPAGGIPAKKTVRLAANGLKMSDE